MWQSCHDWGLWITLFLNLHCHELRLLLLLFCSGVAKEPGALSESGGTSTAEPSEEHRSPGSAALQPLVQTLLRWLPARIQPAEVSLLFTDTNLITASAHVHEANTHSLFILSRLSFLKSLQLRVEIFRLFWKIFHPHFCLNLLPIYAGVTPHKINRTRWSLCQIRWAWYLKFLVEKHLRLLIEPDQ